MTALGSAPRARAVRAVKLAAAAGVLLCGTAHAQDLTPRAYVVTPLKTNAVIVSDIYSDGHLLFDGSVPITGATGRLNVATLTLSGP